MYLLCINPQQIHLLKNIIHLKVVEENVFWFKKIFELENKTKMLKKKNVCVYTVYCSLNINVTIVQ